MAGPLAIAHTEASLGWGGQEIRTLTEAKGFIARGHRVVIYAAPGARILDEAPRFGVPALAVPIGEKQPKGVAALLGAFRANPVDIVNGQQLDRHAWLDARSRAGGCACATVRARC